MNGLEIIVIGIIGVSCFMGYRAGFLRVVYSLFSWLLVLAFVTWATPYLAEFLESNTALQSVIEEKAKEVLEQNAEDYRNERAEEVRDAELWIPQNIAEQITGLAGEVVDEVVQRSDICEEIAKSIAHFIIEGIAFFIALIIASIISHWIIRGLNLVSHLPVLHGVNKVLGGISGCFKGLVIVWLLFYIITLCGTSEFGTELLSYIKESPTLLFLYKNNILMQMILLFL